MHTASHACDEDRGWRAHTYSALPSRTTGPDLELECAAIDSTTILGDRTRGPRLIALFDHDAYGRDGALMIRYERSRDAGDGHGATV